MLKKYRFLFLSFSTLIIVNLMALPAHTRGPAVEGLEKMNEEQIQREKEGKSFSEQYEALQNGAVNEESVENMDTVFENLGFTSLMISFLILLPMGLSYVITSNIEGKRNEGNSENTQISLETENVVELNSFRNHDSQLDGNPEREDKKAS